MPDMEVDKSWHLDKRVPIALLGAIMLQTCAAIWWAASISARVDTLERDRTAMSLAVGPQAERLIRVETKVDSMHEDVNEIKRAIRPVSPIH